MSNNDTSRRANSGNKVDLDSTSRIIQETTGMSPEKSRKVAKQVLEIITKEEQEYRKIITNLSDIESIQRRYLGDNIKLVNVFSEQISDLIQQQQTIKQTLQITKEGSDAEKALGQQYNQNKQLLDEINKVRKNALSQLTEEQQEEANLYKISYDRDRNEKAKLKTLQEERKLLRDEIKVLEKKDKLSDKEQKRLEKLKKKEKEKSEEGKGLLSRLTQKGKEGEKDKKPFWQQFLDTQDDDKDMSIGKMFTLFKGAKAGKGMMGGMTGMTGPSGGSPEGGGPGGGGVKAGLASIALLAGKVLKIVSQIASSLEKFVDDASSFLSDTKGNVNALLRSTDGITDNFNTFLEQSKEALTASTLLTQKEYLSAIKSMASSGIGIDTGLETAAILTAVAEKTVPQFSATNESLRRLVKLGETSATQRFFGLEAILIKSLNKQFGDTSYLNQLFDSVNETMMDAVTNLKDMSSLGGTYEFRSTLQQWMAALYEQGVDNSTINRITTAINALGSGNVSAMSSDAGMQKLILLSLDKAGQDFATILQEGLSADMLHTIMTSMTGYLKDLVGKTDKNNVLESAYANLFGLSMTDMYAFGNKVKAPELTGVGDELNETTSVLSYISDNAYTLISEKVDNVLENMGFTFGQDIANSTWKYATYKGGLMAMKIGDELGGVKGKIINTAGSLAVGIAGLVPLVKTIYHTINGGLEYINSGGENSVLRLYKDVSGDSGAAALYSALGTEISDAAKTGSENFKKISSGKQGLSGDAATAYNTAEETTKKLEAEEADGGPSMKILKELEKTFMKDKGGRMAVAVSLEGLADEVLKSFASIFADEDSMEDVFDTKKKKKKLFKYDGETTSNDDKDDK